MMRLTVLIQAVGKEIWEACKEIEEIEGVKTVKVVIGTFDAIAYAELPELTGLRQLLDSIHRTEGIIRTETCIAI
ncbi:MAG: Lrp/AsnC ligand binding domain-containing protein [Candidatus Hermodarchaeota archaeon]